MRRGPNAFLGLLLAATLTMPAALAQTATGSSEPTPRPSRDATDRVEKRISDLHSKLGITPAEQALWDKFAQVMRDNAQQISQSAGARAAKLRDMSATDNMQSYAQLAMLHAQDLQNLSAAFQPLYAAFSPEQQRTADAMFRDVAIARSARHRH
jgi:hypothetical protein